MGHLCDTERIFSYRLLRVARGDQTPLPGFEENEYVSAGQFDVRALGDLVSEWEAARHSTLALVESVDPDVLNNRTVANDAPVSALALLFIVPGHTQHHLEILRTRYGVGGGS
jgi:DinB superfamily